MIVEDESLIAWDLADGFQEQGFRIAGPFSGCKDALQSLKTGLPDLAILDAVLSDGPCLELARELRSRGVPFLIYSGAEEFEDHAPELEGVRWIQKPAPMESVIQGSVLLITGA